MLEKPWETRFVRSWKKPVAFTVTREDTGLVVFQGVGFGSGMLNVQCSSVAVEWSLICASFVVVAPAAAQFLVIAPP